MPRPVKEVIEDLKNAHDLGAQFMFEDYKAELLEHYPQHYQAIFSKQKESLGLLDIAAGVGLGIIIGDIFTD